MALAPNLPTDITTLQASVLSKNDRIERLVKLVSDFKRALFGSKSEKVSTDQYELMLEDIETAIVAIHTEDELDVGGNTKAKQPRHTN